MNPLISIDFIDEERIERFDGMACWILYTDADPDVGAFVRRYWDFLNELSGKHCMVFVVDQPYQSDATEFWNRIDPSLPKWSKPYRPFNVNSHIEVARKLGVSIARIPCLVFFTSFQSNEVVIFEIPRNADDDNLAECFKSVFSCVDLCFEDDESVPEKGILLGRLETYLRAIRIKALAQRIVLPRLVSEALEILRKVAFGT